MKKLTFALLLLTLFGCSTLAELPVSMKIAHFKAKFCELTPEERLQIRKDIRAVKCAAIGDVHPAVAAFCAFDSPTQAFIMPIIDAKMCGLPEN